MIAAFHFGPDERPLEPRTQRRAHEKIVNAPSDVPRAQAGHLTPPRVMPAVLFKLAEGVEEARVYKRREAGALLGREAVVVNVGRGIRQVNFLVCYVQVAAEDDRLFSFELLGETEEVSVPLLAIGQPREFALRVRHI